MTQGKWWSKIDKMWKSQMGWKMPLCKWHTFWMTPCLICYFIVILFYIERKWLFMRNVAIIVPLKSKSSGKFQRFNTNDEIIEPSEPSPPTPSDEILLRLWNKNFLRKIYRHLLSKCFKNAVLGCQGGMQCKCFFW